MISSRFPGKPVAGGLRWEPARMAGLFWLQGQAIALWFVPFSTVLKTHGMEWLAPYGVGASAVAAFISPMLSGTIADRHLPPTVLLRWLAVATAVTLAMAFYAIEMRWSGTWVLGLMQLQYLCAAPSWGLASVIVLSRLHAPERQFGPIRVFATYGWMAAGVFVSFLLHADGSTRCGFVAALAWLGVAAFTYVLPVAPNTRNTSLSTAGWRGWFGWEALKLLADRDHRAVFVSAGLLSIPLAAFYPFVILQLQELGVTRASAAMSLGQVTEVLAMYALGPMLARWRLKAVLSLALGFCVLRYLLFALDTRTAALIGVGLHGFCYTFFFIPAQIYLEKRIDPALRFRAQALLTLIMAGFGNLLGAVGCGWLRAAYTAPGSGTDWGRYWLVLAGAVACVSVYFVAAYRGGARQPEGMARPVVPA